MRKQQGTPKSPIGNLTLTSCIKGFSSKGSCKWKQITVNTQWLSPLFVAGTQKSHSTDNFNKFDFHQVITGCKQNFLQRWKNRKNKEQQ